MFCGYHDVKADCSLRSNFSGLFKLITDRTQIGLNKVRFKIWLSETDLSSGDKPHSAGLCHSSGQTVEADSNPHSTLDHRFFYFKITNYQWFEITHHILLNL